MPIGAILPLLLGAAAVGTGLAAGSSREEREAEKERRKIEGEQRKETAKILHEQAKHAQETGNMAMLTAAAEGLKKIGLPDEAINPYFEGIKQPMQFQQNFMNLMQNALAQGQGRNAAQGQASALPQIAPQSYTPRTPVAADKVSFASPEEIPHYPIFQQAIAKHGIQDPAHFIALSHGESSFNPEAISPKGALGVTQVMPSTGARFGVTNPKSLRDAAINIDTGAQYFKFLENKYPGRPDLITAAYNAGEGAVDQYGGKVPPFKETQAFVPRVEGLRQQYAQLLNTQPKGVTVTNTVPGQPAEGSPGVVHATDASLGTIAASPAFRPENGISFKIDKNGNPAGMEIDPAKMNLTTQQLLAETLAQNPTLYQAYVNSQVYGNEPLVYEPVEDVQRGIKGTRLRRKVDGAVLGIQWNNFQSTLTPEQQIEQAAKQGAATAAASVVGKAQGSLQPITVPSGETKTPAQIELEQKTAEQAASSEAQATGKRKSELMPVRAALGILESYSKKLHTQKGAVGATINGTIQSLVALSPTGSEARSYKDYSEALVGNIARVFGAERGVLTDKDVARAKSLTVGLFATKEYAETRFKELHQFLAEMEGRPVPTKGEFKIGHVYPSGDGRTFAVYRGTDDQGKHQFEPIDLKSTEAPSGE